MKAVFLALLLMLIAASMNGVQAFMMEPVINDIFVNKEKSLLLPLALVVFGAFVLRGFSTWGQVSIMAKVGQSILAEIQRKLFKRLVGSDLIFFQRHPSGELISRLTSDVQTMRIAVAEGLTGFAQSFLTLFFLVGVMFYQDWKLSALAFTIFPAASFIVHKIGRKIRYMSGDTQSEMANFSSFLNQIFQGVRHVKANVMEEHEQKRASSIIERLFKLNTKIIRTSALSKPLSETLSAIAVVSIILYGGLQVINGSNTPGAFFSFITAFIMAYEPIKRLAKLNNSLQTGLAAAERVFDMLDNAPSSQDRDGRDLLTLDNGAAPAISFRNVTFAYPDGTLALDGVNLDIKPGEKVALVGPSGSGKSTLINLIPRFFDISEGSDGVILINGRDIREFTLASLRAQIGLVSQDPAVFDETVTENILYGRPEADQQDIITAAKKAHAHQFIEDLEEGYETRLGEHGVRLSGGQKQRIAIARTILRDAPILLLDEATSALDNEAERVVSQGLKTLEEGRTTLMIAHRLSTVIDADRICVMKDGKIVEQGSHQALLDQDGLYTTLYGRENDAQQEVA